LPLPHRLLAHQGEVGLESGLVAGAGIELDSGGKQSASIEASSCLPLAFCCLSQAFSSLSCSVSFSIRSLSLLTRKISFSSCYGFAGLRLHSQLVLHPALLEMQHPPLDIGIPSPIQHRQQLSPARQ
jgi:hypothetical protein